MRLGVVLLAIASYSILAGASPGILRAAVKVFRSLLAPGLLQLVLAAIGVQFFVQPVLHYWQPLFRSIEPAINSRVASSSAGRTSVSA